LEDHQFIGEYIPIISLAFWQKLPPDLRQLFTDLWQEKVAAYRAEMASAQSHARSLVEEHGISIIAPSPEELAAMREQMITHQDEVARLSRISREMLVAVSADIEAD
jgi:C4-dicarboxylate-binding protein DctP